MHVGDTHLIVDAEAAQGDVFSVGGVVSACYRHGVALSTWMKFKKFGQFFGYQFYRNYIFSLFPRVPFEVHSRSDCELTGRMLTSWGNRRIS